MRLNRFDCLILAFIISLPLSWTNFGSMSVYRMVTIVCFQLWLYFRLFSFPVPSKDNRKLFISWIAYAGYCIIAYVLYPSNASVVFGMILLVMISLIFFSSQIDINMHKYIDYMWMIAGLFFEIFFLFGKTAQLGWGTRQTLVIFGTSTDANEFASFFVIALSIALYYLICEKKIIIRVLSGVLFVLGIYVVLMSGSRGALLSLIVALLFTLFGSKKFSIGNIILIIVIVFALVVILPTYILPLIPKETLSRLTLDALQSDNGSGRSDIWLAALEIFIHDSPFRWIFGYGYWGLYVTTWVGTTGTMHNQYVQQLIAYGIIGLFLYLNLIINAYKRINCGLKRYKGAFIGILFMGLTLSMGPSYKMLWILLFMAGITSSGVVNEK